MKDKTELRRLLRECNEKLEEPWVLAYSLEGHEKEEIGFYFIVYHRVYHLQNVYLCPWTIFKEINVTPKQLVQIMMNTSKQEILKYYLKSIVEGVGHA